MARRTIVNPKGTFLGDRKYYREEIITSSYDKKCKHKWEFIKGGLFRVKGQTHCRREY